MPVMQAERTEIAQEPSELVETLEQRKKLRQRADRAELRLALADFAESLRGFIRAAPFTAVIGGALVGVAMTRRKRRRPAKRVVR